MSRMFPEKDWKMFRKKIVEWQEAYMDKLLHEYEEIIHEDTDPSDRFWKLNERIRYDRKSSGVSVQMSRSNLLHNLCMLLDEGVISKEDLADFSDELKETVNFLK